MIAFTTLVWLRVAFDWRSEPESASNLTVVVVVYSNSNLFAVRDQVIWSGFSSGSRKVDADPACCMGSYSSLGQRVLGCVVCNGSMLLHNESS